MARGYEPDVPRFSLAERDRRWGRVRQLMVRDRLDVIVVPRFSGNWDGGNANARYLSGLGGNGAGASVVFPLTGEVTAVVGPVPAREYWLAFQEWVTDIRFVGQNQALEGGSGTGGFRSGGGVIARLRELQLERGRIGLAGLSGSPRLPDGIVPHGLYASLHEAFPDAELVDASELLDEARAVKSAEEIGFMERSMALTEVAVDTLINEARPGVPEATVYARMLASMVERGGELPTMLLWSAGSPQPYRTYMMPSQKPLRAGDVINAEIDGNYGGYRAQFTITATMGRAGPAYHEMFRVQQAALHACYDHLQPGIRLGELLPVCEAAAEGTPYTCRLIIHSRGLGDDAPVIVFGTRDPKLLNWPVEENMSFIVKPVVWAGEWEQFVCWGDQVVVTAHGPRRLGTRPPALLEIL